MNLTRKIYATRNEKTLDFVIGFLGWFIVNSTLGGVIGAVLGLISSLGAKGDNPTLQNIVGAAGLTLSCLPLLINLGALVYLSFTRYWIALGALAAFAVVLVLVICAAVVFGVACFALLGGLSPPPVFPTPLP